MIQMDYHPSTNGKYGLTSHLYALSIQPMQIGHLYEIKFWLYVPSSKKADPDWAKHIGIALLPEKVTFPLFTKTRAIPALTIDTVLYDAWYQAKWRVRPLCTSHYLMIGLFADDRWPVSQSYTSAFYYVDNVTLREIPSNFISVDRSTYYCSRYDPKTNPNLTPRIDNVLLYFESDKFDLNIEDKAALDSFALFAKKYPDLVFEVSGHTDSTGSANLTLSQNRVQSVLRYLTKVRQLPEFRFVPISLGSKNPIRSNKDEVGREMNRRAEIRQSHRNLPMVFYKNALQAVKEQRYPEAFSYLNKWLYKVNQGDWIVLLFDPRFETLKKDKRWAALEQKVRDGYRNFKYPKYAFLIDSLRMDDLMILGELSVVLNDLSGNFIELDSVPFYLPPMPEAEVQKKFREHYSAFRPILEKTGWPKKSEFGESASTSAFFLLQHSLDSNAYVKWLPILQKTCEEGEASWMNYAMLYDRCQLIAGKPQRYATHSEVLLNGALRVLPWEGDENTINEHRAKIGLPLLPANIVEAMQRNE